MFLLCLILGFLNEQVMSYNNSLIINNQLFANLSGIMIQAFQRLSLTSTQYYTQISSSQFSQKLVDCRGFKRLDSLIITNFKSFKGKVYVGPLLDFTSIVGPNGAGKSNVLDALMFCFSNEKIKLTVSDIREFINREGLQTYNQMTKKNKYCEVQARFILHDDRPFTLSRTLYPDQRQLFVIDGDEYSQKIYENFLIKCNINYIASNFAISQGEIDKLLARNPKELTAHIENISGSIFFKKQYEDLKNEIAQIDSYLQTRSLRLVKLKQSKKTLKNMNNQKNSFMKIQSQYEQILRKIALIRSYRSDLEIKQFQNSIKAKEKQESEKIKQINQDKIRLQKQQSQKIQLENKITKLIKQISQSATRLKNSELFTNVIDVQTISELNKTVQNLKKYLQNLITRKSQLQKQMSQIQSNDVNKEYLELYSRWEKQNESINKQISKRKDQYLYVLGILQTKKNIIEDYKQKQLKANDLSKQEVRQKQELQTSIQQLQKVITKMKTQHSKLTQQLSKNKSRREELMQKIIKKNQEIIQLQSLFTQNVDNQKDKELLLKLNQIEGFQGAIQQRLSPSNKKYQICFQLMMGPILKYLLCLNETSSKQIAVKLKENYQMKNMVILKNVQERKQLVSRTILGKLGIQAIDAVQFDKNITNLWLFLKQYLNGKIICDTIENAWELLGQNIKGVRQIYTLDGNLIRSDGMVSSYGAIETTKHKYRYVDMAKNMSAIGKDIEHLKKQKVKLEEQLQITKKKTNQDLIASHNVQIQKLQSKRQELKMRLLALKNSIQNKREIKIPKGLETQLEELQKRAKKLEQSMNEIEKEMLKSKIFSQFMKKNNISLQNFRNVQDLSSLQGAIKLKSKYIKQLQEIDREITKIKQQIDQKNTKLQHLNQKVKSIVSVSQRQGLQKAKKNKEAELAATRNQLSKISSLNVETLKFKSEVPQLIAKLQVMKQRKHKMIKQELQSLGLQAEPTTAQYSKLEEQFGFRLQRASKERLQNTFEDLEKQKVELQTEIQKNNINLPDVRIQIDNEERIQSEMERLSNQIKQHTERRSQLLSKLQTVKAQRKSVFMNFMQEMKPILQNAYQMLTQKVGAAGKAQIYLQNQQFPCDYGIYYTPIPPLKKFVYDLDQLSGGQKSIASLALQYAITVTSKSPFLILDQTDAFLDSQNVNRFKNLINHTLQKNRKLQLILITHKRSLFLSGKSLVGVTKFKDDPFSKAFSLRLRDAENPADQQQKY